MYLHSVLSLHLKIPPLKTMENFILKVVLIRAYLES